MTLILRTVASIVATGREPVFCGVGRVILLHPDSFWPVAHPHLEGTIECCLMTTVHIPSAIGPASMSARVLGPIRDLKT